VDKGRVAGSALGKDREAGELGPVVPCWFKLGEAGRTNPARSVSLHMSNHL